MGSFDDRAIWLSILLWSILDNYKPELIVYRDPRGSWNSIGRSRLSLGSTANEGGNEPNGDCLLKTCFHRERAESPNDPKLSDRGGWRGGCEGGAKKEATDVEQRPARTRGLQT